MSYNTSIHPDEAQWVQGLIAGDAEAFRNLYTVYQQKVYAFAFRLTKSPDSARDIVQEVFIKLWEKRDQVRPDLSFPAYIKKITQNHTLNFLRNMARNSALQEKVKSNLQILRNTEPESLLEKELLKAYREAVDQLPERQREVYILSREEELSYEQIARQLNISPNTVRNQMVDALKHIRDHVSKNTDLTALILAICLLDQ